MILSLAALIWLLSRCPHPVSMWMTINKQMMEWMSTFDGGVEQREYLSADGTVGVETQGLYPTEFLNSLNFSGVPPHKLLLRVGCPIILLTKPDGAWLTAPA